VFAVLFVAVFAAYRAEAFAVLPANDLNGNIQDKKFPQDGIEIQGRFLGDRQFWFDVFLRWVYEEFVDFGGEGLVNFVKAADAFDRGVGREFATHINTLPGSSRVQGAGQVTDFKITVDNSMRYFKFKVAAVSDVLVKQEADVKPQRVTFVQVRTAWQFDFLNSASIIA